MAVVELVGEMRRRTGKGGSRQVRRDGFIPAVLYGTTHEPLSIKIQAKAFEQVTRHHGGIHSVIEFTLPGRPETLALIREIQRDPISRQILHLDFQSIEAGKPVTVVVPLALTGVPRGVREGGGVLEHIAREIEVRCLPRDIPGRWEVDVSGLNVGDHLSVGDLVLPNMEILTEGDRTIATVVAPTVVIEPKAEEAEAAEGEGVPGEGAAKEGEGSGQSGGKDKEKDK